MIFPCGCCFTASKSSGTQFQTETLPLILPTLEGRNGPRSSRRRMGDAARMIVRDAAAPDRMPNGAALLMIKHGAEIAHVEPAFKEVKLNCRRPMLPPSVIAWSGPLFQPLWPYFEVRSGQQQYHA
jgi:hypothetical protein